jgi:histidinol-phosphate aminotransferase
MIRVPEYVASIKPYVPGKPVEELERELGITGSVKLASNENPAGPSIKAMKALNENLIEALNRYPDGGGYYLKQALSKKFSVRTEELIIGNGSNELIDIAVRTFMKPGDEAIMAWPSFVVYPMSVQAQGCRGVKVQLRDFTHDLEAMAYAVTDNTRMFFIANPNNPTGTINKDEEFVRLVERLPEDIIIIVDEAYYEYVQSPSYADSMKHFRNGKNVLMLRTFSKIYGLAGLRIGYGIAKEAIIEELNKIREPFNTSSAAQAAALAALEDEEHVERSRRINEEGKKYLYGQLDSLGVEYVQTEANFIYVLLKQDSGEVYESLLRQGVIVRPMGPGALRVTIGLKKENEKFVEALKTVISNL